MTRTALARSLCLLTLGAALGACTHEDEAQAPAGQPPPKPASPAPAAPAPAATAPRPTVSDPECVGRVAEGPAQQLTFGGVKWTLSGSTMTLATRPKGKDFVIGVLSDIKEASPENLANLERFRKWFKKKGARMVLVAGDSGTTAGEVTQTLGAVAKLGVPVFAIIGNREGKAIYRAAVATLHAKPGNVFDLGEVRRVDTPDVDVVSLPGYYDAAHLHAADGCRYFPDDVDALAPIVKACNSPVLLISHGGPRQSGPLALDYTSDAKNVGDPHLAKVMSSLAIPFGVFGNIHEAGGRATDLGGETVLPQKKPLASFFLHPGPADAVRWALNDGTHSVGMAAIIAFAGGKARYEVLRLEDPEARKTKGKKPSGRSTGAGGR
jgi:Icc-related predicted phosphoesterase